MLFFFVRRNLLRSSSKKQASLWHENIPHPPWRYAIIVDWEWRRKSGDIKSDRVASNADIFTKDYRILQKSFLLACEETFAEAETAKWKGSRGVEIS